MKNKVDLVFGLTHLELGQDKEFLERIPQIPLVMGGHEHYAMSVSIGNSKITKADANAKTIYIHTLVYNTVNKDLKIDSELFNINDKITSKPEIENIVNKWGTILNLKIKRRESFRPFAFSKPKTQFCLNSFLALYNLISYLSSSYTVCLDSSKSVLHLTAFSTKASSS